MLSGLQKFLLSLGITQKSGQDYKAQLNEITNHIRITANAIIKLDSGERISKEEQEHIDNFAMHLQWLRDLKKEICQEPIEPLLQLVNEALNFALVVERNIARLMAMAFITLQNLSREGINVKNTLDMTMHLMEHEGHYHIFSRTEVCTTTMYEEQAETSTRVIYDLMQFMPSFGRYTLTPELHVESNSQEESKLSRLFTPVSAREEKVIQQELTSLSSRCVFSPKYGN